MFYNTNANTKKIFTLGKEASPPPATLAS